MSNLIKYNYIAYNKDDKKIIDSDSRSDLFKPLAFARVEDLTPESTEEEEDLDSAEPAAEEEEPGLTEKAEEILNAAREQAGRIVEEAEQQAESIRSEAFRQGQEEGYEEGNKSAAEEIEELEHSLNQQILENQKEYQMQLEQLEPLFVNLMVSYLEKLTGIIIEDKRDVILHLVTTAVHKVERNHNFLIRVSGEDYSYVNSKREQLAATAGEEASVEIIEDKTFGKNQCIIETDDRIIDCSLDVQLKGLVDDLKLLACELNNN